jgi:predicted NAD/FAD-binding protein
MILDIVRFNQFALDLLSEETQTSISNSVRELSIGEYLELNGYSDAFRDDYLIPMTACVWSTGPEKCALEFPAMTLVRFMWNHHLLTTISERPPWLTVEGGAQRYIDAVLEACPHAEVHLGTPVMSLVSKKDRATLTFGGKRESGQEEFDEVVLACHGNQALRIVGETATMEQKKILSAFKTTLNMAYLHSDLSVRLSTPL